MKYVRRADEMRNPAEYREIPASYGLSE